MGEEMGILTRIEALVDSLESTAVDLIARLAPWAAPAPTAYLVFARTTHHLVWPAWVGVTAALVIESLGLAVMTTALDLYRYNASKRRSDPVAPLALPLVLVGVYFGAAELLTVALDVAPKLAAGTVVTLVDWAPAVFPILSVAGMATLALRADHRRRLAIIETERAGRRATRRGYQQAPISGGSDGQSSAQQDTVLDTVNRTRQERKSERMTALLDAYRADPDLGATAAARLLGVHRNTVHTYISELEAAGRFARRDGRVQVLEAPVRTP